MRSLLVFLLTPAALLLAQAGHAQLVSIYGTFSPTHLSNIPTSESVCALQCTTLTQYTSFWAPSVGGGVTIGMFPLGPIHLGADFRGSTKSGTNGADTFLTGLKLGVKLPAIKIKPYIQGSAGYLATRTANGIAVNGNETNKYLAWEILGGIDYAIAHFVDFRLVEVGGGQAITIGPSTSPNPSLLTINSGVVFHF